MTHYRHIMVATKKLPLKQHVLRQIKELAAQNQAKVSLLHTVPKLGPGIVYSLPSVKMLEQQQLEEAKQQLHEVAESLGVLSSDQHVTQGSTNAFIAKTVRKQHVDLLIINLKSQAKFKSMLRKAGCDILII